MRHLLPMLLLTLDLHAERQYPLTLRGLPQDVTVYSAEAKTKAGTAVIFLPGDGGWRGFAVDMARALTRSGFDVFGWDVKGYLTGFTSRSGPLQPAQMQTDIGTLSAAVRGAGYRKVVLVGWSQGAAMAALAAAAPQAKESVAGVVLLGLPESGVLGWRFADNLTYLTKSEPNEPRFFTAPVLPLVAPIRVAMIQSTADEYIPLEKARQLFTLAKEPKRFLAVSARNHRYEGNQDEFLRILAEQVRWAESVQ